MTNDLDPTIVDYDPVYGDAFARLNREWLEEYFRVEPIDEEIFADPVATILRPGGVILYAVSGEEAVGTVALKYHGGAVCNLSKMAGTGGQRGLGLGRRLRRAAVDRYAGLGGKTMYLESHSSLRPAIALYESAGFVHEPPPSPSEYERADVYMVYRPK